MGRDVAGGLQNAFPTEPHPMPLSSFRKLAFAKEKNDRQGCQNHEEGGGRKNKGNTLRELENHEGQSKGEKTAEVAEAPTVSGNPSDILRRA